AARCSGDGLSRAPAPGADDFARDADRPDPDGARARGRQRSLCTARARDHRRPGILGSADGLYCSLRVLRRLSLERGAGKESGCQRRHQHHSRAMNRMKLLITLLSFATATTFAADTNNLQTLTLSAAQEFALKNHPQIAAANYRVLAAQEVTKESRAGFFPQANIYGSAVGADSVDTRIEAGGLNNPSVFDRAAGGVSVNQLIT